MCELNVLSFSIVYGDDWGGVLRAVRPVFASPKHIACGFVQSGERAFLSAGCADYFISIDKHGLGVAPARDASAEIIGEAFGPNLFSGFCIDADQISASAQGIDAVAIDGWCASWAVTPVITEDGSDLCCPDFIAIGRIQADQDGLSSACAECVESVADNGHTGVAFAGGLIHPEFVRSFGGPFLEKALFLGDVGAIGASPARPVTGRCFWGDAGKTNGYQGNQHQTAGHGSFPFGSVVGFYPIGC